MGTGKINYILSMKIKKNKHITSLVIDRSILFELHAEAHR